MLKAVNDSSRMRISTLENAPLLSSDPGLKSPPSLIRLYSTLTETKQLHPVSRLHTIYKTNCPRYAYITLMALNHIPRGSTTNNMVLQLDLQSAHGLHEFMIPYSSKQMIKYVLQFGKFT